jgi:peptide/nickel transport system ATP-binding protein
VSLLEVSDLTTVFHLPTGDIRAVNRVSFTLEKGEVMGIVGESGSGKSVTARSLMRMVRHPGEIVSGKVLLNGVDLLSLEEKEMRAIRGKQIAMVFQDPQATLNPVHTIGAQISEALIVHGSSKEEAKTRSIELLNQVGIPNPEVSLDRYPHELSGGMRQRVVIAIALANKAELLIADEPTTALDVTIQAQILQLLLQLRDSLGISIIMITHDMGVIAEVCDKTLVMYGGRVVERGEVVEIFNKPLHPYTAALLSTVPRISSDRSEELVAIPGSPPDPANLPQGCAFSPRCNFAESSCSSSVPDLIQISKSGFSACFVREKGHNLDFRPNVSRKKKQQTQLGSSSIITVSDVFVDVGSKRKGLFGSKSPAVNAVAGLSLEIRPGETLGLVGESGCGKSTLSRAIVGINSFTSGKCVIAGRDVTQMNAEDRQWVSSHVQYVFQDPFASLNPRRTIAQSIGEALNVAGVDSSEIDKRAAELMERVGLDPKYLDRFPYAFSGGQRQRIGIARALAAKPKILILDEPVSALDVSIQAQIINLLQELRDDLGLAFLFIAHDLSVVRHLSDRVAVMYLGKIVEIGSAEDIYGNPKHPYTKALLASSPEPEVNKKKDLTPALQGTIPSPAKPPSGCRFRSRCPIGPIHITGRTICETEEPSFELLDNGHMAACHFLLEKSK